MAMRRWAILYVVLERKSQAEARSVYGRGQTCLGFGAYSPRSSQNSFSATA
jgi:hypothetical protein